MDIHPYYPQNLTLSGGIFKENEWTVTLLIASFASCLVFLLVAARLLALRVNPRLLAIDMTYILWFVMSGTIHLFFEAFFVLHNEHIASMQTFFAQLWKEYALSDSRYMSSDPLVLCTGTEDRAKTLTSLLVETWTVVLWGPLCLVTAACIALSSPYRHPIQALVSTGHLYGNILYLSTCLYEDIYLGRQYYRPEPYYFWVYFVCFNLPWLIVPTLCLYNSIRETAKAFALSAKSANMHEGKTK